MTIGNLFIVVLFAQSRDLQKRRYCFLLNLAVADFLVGAVAEPLFVYILGGFYGLWRFKDSSGGGSTLLTSIFVDMLSGIASICFLTVIALERLYATLYPTKYRVTNKQTYAVIICTVWLTSLFMPIIRITLGSDKSLYVWMPTICLLLVVIGVAYAIIWARLLLSASRRLHHHGRERRLNVTVTILTLSSLSTWLPFIILNTVNYFRVVNDPVTVHATKLLHYGNSVVNPLLFALRMPKFRKAARTLLCRGAHAPENINYFRDFPHGDGQSSTKV